MDAIPIWLLFIGTSLLVIAFIEAGFRVGRVAYRRSDHEKEAPVSGIAASVLGLLAFMLAFTFGIVSGRYDERKSLVREEANAIRAAYLCTDLLHEPDHIAAEKLTAQYLDLRLEIVQQYAHSPEEIARLLAETERVQAQLWETVMASVDAGLNSDYASLNVEALNTMFEIQALRIAIGIQARAPAGIWIVLYTLAVLGMFGVGYQTALSDSKRSWAIPILAIAFSIVVSLVAELDRPTSDLFRVSQQPLIDVQSWIARESGAAAPAQQ